MKDIDLSRLHCGVFNCPIEAAPGVMPELAELFRSAPRMHYTGSTVVNVKVCMLMPGQYPCIPGWHVDFAPRDRCGVERLEQRNKMHRMALLCSGPPFTQWKDGRSMKPWEWTAFSQFDEHRGQPATEHCWRLFMRVAPSIICPPAKPEQWLRRHCQIYCDAETFKW